MPVKCQLSAYAGTDLAYQKSDERQLKIRVLCLNCSEVTLGTCCHETDSDPYRFASVLHKHTSSQVEVIHVMHMANAVQVIIRASGGRHNYWRLPELLAS